MAIRTVSGAFVIATLLMVATAVLTARPPANSTVAAASAPPNGTAAPPAVDPKAQRPPAGYTPPPEPARYAARNAPELLANLVKDPFGRTALDSFGAGGRFVANAKGPSSLGTPIFVRALAVGGLDEWLVPILSDGGTVGVITIDVFPDGTAQTGGYGPWSRPFPHPLTPEAARAVAGTPTDPGGSVELVWATISPFNGGPANRTNPFYRVVRTSGAEVYVLQSGEVRMASDFGLNTK